MKFDVLDNISLFSKTLLMSICALSCCWGFMNNSVLLVLASKIGFPMAVAICAMSNNRRQILNVFYYTIFPVLFGTLYFFLNDATIEPLITKNFLPSFTDFFLAVGLGAALSYFWNHTIRINIIVMSAGLASLLPACIMTGYWFSNGSISLAISSLLLHLEYVIGIVLGSAIINYLEKNKWNQQNP